MDTKRNEEFLIIRVKKCYSIIIPLFFFTCSLNGEYHEKDRFYRSHLFELLIDGNRFVSVKRKKSLTARERERNDFSLLFIHIPSVSLPPINSIDFALSSKFHTRASALIRHRCSPYFSPPAIARLIQRLSLHISSISRNCHSFRRDSVETLHRSKLIALLIGQANISSSFFSRNRFYD